MCWRVSTCAHVYLCTLNLTCQHTHTPTQTSVPFKSWLFFPPSEIAAEESGKQSDVNRRTALQLREGTLPPAAPSLASWKSNGVAKSPSRELRGWELGGVLSLLVKVLDFPQLPCKESSSWGQQRAPASCCSSQYTPGLGGPRKVGPRLGGREAGVAGTTCRQLGSSLLLCTSYGT